MVVFGEVKKNIQEKNQRKGDRSINNKSNRRSEGILEKKRIPNKWPDDQEFRILSLDGGGIKGIFQAAFLEKLESEYLKRGSVTNYFDLICGTSAGGIIALGFGAGMKASEILNMYMENGEKIFHKGYFSKLFSGITKYLYNQYETKNLRTVLEKTFKDKKLQESKIRLCIPSFEGKHSEVYVFKTPHHLDFKKDFTESMLNIALATSAAPTFFKPYMHNKYTFVDGGVWANNPCMIGLVEALSSFDVKREKIKILSIGCGQSPYIVKRKMIVKSGMFHWKKIIYGAMHLQSMNAIGQAGLLIGRDRIFRIDVPKEMLPKENLELDDWKVSKKTLPNAAKEAFSQQGEKIKCNFFNTQASPYEPLYSLQC